MEQKYNLQKEYIKQYIYQLINTDKYYFKTKVNSVSKVRQFVMTAMDQLSTYLENGVSLIHSIKILSGNSDFYKEKFQNQEINKEQILQYIKQFKQKEIIKNKNMQSYLYQLVDQL